MDYQKVLDITENKLNKKFDFVINDIKNCIESGSTRGEISSILGKYLKDLKVNNYQAYAILEEDINKYISDCRKNGLKIFQF